MAFTMNVPPVNQGQIVEISYGWDEDGRLYRRTYDQSDCSESWDVARSTGHIPDDWHPVNEPPPRRTKWKPCPSPVEKDRR